MEYLINECYDFMKESNLAYAFCGGYALELFTGEKNRTHSDLDITLFDEDKKGIIDYILSKGWEVYEPLHTENCLKKITNSSDESVANCFYIWAIKPNCTFFKIQPKICEDSIYNYEILDDEQKNFDFIDIIFNNQKDGNFFCDNDKDIRRELDKAILYNKHIPFLAPELILFFISNPAYIESDYHREKNNIDFKVTPPLLVQESLDWLINAIETAYPNGNKRLDQLKILRQGL